MTWTIPVDKPKLYNRRYLYWYQFIFTNADASTTYVYVGATRPISGVKFYISTAHVSVYYVTLISPMLPVVDLWDGVERDIGSCRFWNNSASKYLEYTTNSLKEDFILVLTLLTLFQSGTMSTSDYLLLGFDERMAGIGFIIVTDKENDNAATMTVNYGTGPHTLLQRDSLTEQSGHLPRH